MAALKRTPIDRPSGAELVRQIANETAELPPTRREPGMERSVAPSSPPAPSTATEQIKFQSLSRAGADSRAAGCRAGKHPPSYCPTATRRRTSCSGR